jgi:hypothetical protein
MLDEFLGSVATDREIIVAGISAGALVALGMRSSHIKARVVVEPFLKTANLWPLIEVFRNQIIAKPRIATYISELLGYGPSTLEQRDYINVLKNAEGPLFALVGDIPLGEPRSLVAWPSLTDNYTRAELCKRGRVIETAGGHDLLDGTEGRTAFETLLREVVALDLAKDDEQSA